MKIVTVFLFLLINAPVFAIDEAETAASQSAVLFDEIAQEVREEYDFHGLAIYLNNVGAYLVSKDSCVEFDLNSQVKIESDQWLAFVGRFDVKAVKVSELLNSTNTIDQSELIENFLVQLKQSEKIYSKSELQSIAQELDQLRYQNLWFPFAYLAKLVEGILVFIQKNVVSNWGLVIIIFGLFIKIILLPVVILISNFEKKISQIKSILIPKLNEIKANYDGEEAHNRLMAAHKELGVTPFYTLKPMIGLVIQIPILIAIFNALGEMAQFNNQSFLWIDNLAYPDFIAELPFAIPLFGQLISLLPFIMTAVTLLSTYYFSNSYAAADELKQQKIKLTLMAVVFFILFYPFPAVMVLYWTVSNVLYVIQQKLVKI